MSTKSKIVGHSVQLTERKFETLLYLQNFNLWILTSTFNMMKGVTRVLNFWNYLDAKEVLAVELHKKYKREAIYRILAG